MFQQAKKTAPCLIFIDELDAVGRQRGAGLGGGNDEREQTLNQLLIEMDGFSDNSGIIVLAATNRDDVLDPALLRAGRFDRKITVSLPDRAGRTAIFKVHARGKIIDDEVDFDAISRRTVGFSGADIESVLNDAAILAIRDNSDNVKLRHIDEAIDRRIAGPARTTRQLNEHERKVIAYHEAGHAVIGLKHPYSDKVQKITIIPRGQTGGHVLMTPEEDRFLLTKNQLFARIVGYLGGRTSEEVFFDDVSTGAQNDIEVATRIARLMVTEFGMSDLGPIQYERDTGSVFLGRDYTSSQKNFSQQVALEIDKAVRKIIEQAHDKAREIIEENREDVILIAETLLDRETITAEQIDRLLKDRKLDEPSSNSKRGFN
jgi:cell division protease FtsH